MIVRVKRGVQATTWDEKTQSYVTLVEGTEFDSDDPVVKANGWAFATDVDSEKDSNRRPARVTSIRVEDATANPGEKRNR